MDRYIAWAIIYLRVKDGENYSVGYTVLEELIQSSPSRPEAYLALWQLEYRQNKENALMIAE